MQARPYECPAGEDEREEGNWTGGHSSDLGSLVSTGEPFKIQQEMRRGNEEQAAAVKDQIRRMG